jgi:hypothetical protein
LKDFDFSHIADMAGATRAAGDGRQQQYMGRVDGGGDGG